MANACQPTDLCMMEVSVTTLRARLGHWCAMMASMSRKWARKFTWNVGSKPSSVHSSLGSRMPAFRMTMSNILQGEHGAHASASAGPTNSKHPPTSLPPSPTPIHPYPPLFPLHFLVPNPLGQCLHTLHAGQVQVQPVNLDLCIFASDLLHRLLRPLSVPAPNCDVVAALRRQQQRRVES